MAPIISVEKVSKFYRLGTIGGGTLRGDVQRWWARLRGQGDPLLKLGQEDHRNRDGEYIWALKDVSFEVEEGEVLGIIGRNGAGKSTLLKILSRVTAPTSGEIKVNGRIASLLEVGTGFHPELTGRENTYLNGAILGMSRKEIKKKFDEIVEFAEIEKFIDTPVKRYSSGMYVRLAFAVAAHLESEIMLVDEVLAVGDADFQNKCLGKMGNVTKNGRTVLFVSHNMGAVLQLCKRGILLANGMPVCDDDIHVTVEHYQKHNVNDLMVYNNLENFDRTPEQGGKFRFTGIFLEDHDDPYINLWDPLNFRIEYKAFSSMSNIIVGMTVVRLDDIAVFTVESEDTETKWDFMKGDSGSLRVSIPHPNLSPGRYFVRIGAHSGAQSLDWLDQVLFFEVKAGFSTYPTRNANTHGMCPLSNWVRK